jgi:hypothetical protein
MTGWLLGAAFAISPGGRRPGCHDYEDVFGAASLPGLR